MLTNKVNIKYDLRHLGGMLDVGTNWTVTIGSIDSKACGYGKGNNMQNSMDGVLNLTIVIPSYNPDEKLQKVVEGLREKGFHDIVVVNDGSDKEHLKPFEYVGNQCTVIHHKENKGKGRAMKTAFSFCMENRKKSLGVITVDGDNQHHPDDVYACGKALLEHSDHLILGCRNFASDDVPFKSKYGNNITKGIFRVLCGLKISDTQTGLRAISMKQLPEIAKIRGERYEFETNMLLETKNMEMAITEVPIKTIYINDNESSHFNPIKDSIKIYGMIIKFFMNSIASTAIDLGLFFVISLLLGKMNLMQGTIVFMATAIARACSSLFNYKVNRNVVFGQGNSLSIVKYYVLCVCQMMVSATIVALISNWLVASSLISTVIKAVTDTCLFFISFRIQKNWVFKKETRASDAEVLCFRHKLPMKKAK